MAQIPIFQTCCPIRLAVLVTALATGLVLAIGFVDLHPVHGAAGPAPGPLKVQPTPSELDEARDALRDTATQFGILREKLRQRRAHHQDTDPGTTAP